MTRFLFLIAALMASGCSKDVVDIVATAWSDDSEQIAFLERSYEKKYNGSDYAIKNIEYRIGTIGRDGGSIQYRTDQFSGGGSDNLYRNKELYFRSRAGYFLVRVGNSGTSVRDDRIFTDTHEYYLYDMSGNLSNTISKTQEQYCKTFNTYIPSIRAVPSPSGDLIAKVETTSDCELEIRILDYNNNLSTKFSKRIDGLAVAGLFWVNESNLLINSCLWIGCTEGWVLLRVGAEKAIPISAELFNSICLEGVIVSSSVNAAGDKVDNNLAIGKNETYSGTELNSRTTGPTRSPDNPENCVDIENI